jgi:hypothetical protein
VKFLRHENLFEPCQEGRLAMATHIVMATRREIELPERWQTP